MDVTNENELWSNVIVDELLKNGVENVCVCPGSRNTPLTVALSRRDELTIYSQLDERSAGFFALGQAKQSGLPTVLLSTSGTATAEFHPAVMEADQARVPLLVLTADRPPELRDSGSNQTVDQTGLYGNAVRRSETLPEPEAYARKLRSLRVSLCRSIRATDGPDSGPVHVNVPFRKPLQPTPDARTIPDEFLSENKRECLGRDGPFVQWTTGHPEPNSTTLNEIAKTIVTERRGWIVSGPENHWQQSPDTLLKLSDKTGFPLLADPLSGVRFHPDTDSHDLISGYDGYLSAEFEELDPPDVILRFGANPTATKRLVKYLGNIDAQQILVDPSGQWPESEFTATDLIETTPESILNAVENIDQPSAIDVGWKEEWLREDREYWDSLGQTRKQTEDTFEGNVVSEAVKCLPNESHMFVSNSLPIRDLGQFVPDLKKRVHVHANRGCSGIDGITSTALGVKSQTEAPLLAVVGDLAFFHDLNGLLSLKRHGINATLVVINNDGGGIFHRLPIKEFDPPFSELVNTPHGLTFESIAECYDCDYQLIEKETDLSESLANHVSSDGPSIVEVTTDGERNEEIRQELLPSYDTE